MPVRGTIACSGLPVKETIRVGVAVVQHLEGLNDSCYHVNGVCAGGAAAALGVPIRFSLTWGVTAKDK